MERKRERRESEGQNLGGRKKRTKRNGAEKREGNGGEKIPKREEEGKETCGQKERNTEKKKRK